MRPATPGASADSRLLERWIPPKAHPASEQLLRDAWILMPDIKCLLRRYTRDSPDVDDLVQDTFIRVLRYAREGHSIRNLRAFVMDVSRRLALDWIRHQDVRSTDDFRQDELESVPDSGADVEANVCADQELQELVSAGGTMTPRWQQLFILRKIYGYSQKEISHMLGISENTVEQLVVRSMRCLAEYNQIRSRSYPRAPTVNPFLARPRKTDRP